MFVKLMMVSFLLTAVSCTSRNYNPNSETQDARTTDTSSHSVATLKSEEGDNIKISFDRTHRFEYRSSWDYAKYLTIEVESEHFAVAGVSRDPRCAVALEAHLVNISTSSGFYQPKKVDKNVHKIRLQSTGDALARPCRYVGKLTYDIPINMNIYEQNTIMNQTLAIWNVEKTLEDDRSWMHDSINKTHDFELNIYLAPKSF